MEELVEEGADGRAGTVGFRAGRGGGDFVDGEGKVGLGLVGAVGVVALLSRDLGDFRGTYGRALPFSEAALAGPVSTDRLLNAAMASETEGVDTPDGSSSSSGPSPSDDSETDWKEEVESACP